jgi:hypothetical protein
MWQGDNERSGVMYQEVTVAYIRLLSNEPQPRFKSTVFRMSVKHVISALNILVAVSEWWVLCMLLHRRLLKRYETFLDHNTGFKIRTKNLRIINQFCHNVSMLLSRIILLEVVWQLNPLHRECQFLGNGLWVGWVTASSARKRLGEPTRAVCVTTGKLNCSTRCCLDGKWRITLRGLLVDCRPVRKVRKDGVTIEDSSTGQSSEEDKYCGQRIP